LQVVNDPNFANTAKDALTVESKSIQWKALDAYTIVAELPSVFAPFLRKLDGTTLPILPKHKWEQSFKAGKLLESLSVSMNPSDSVSLGAFVLKNYRPGEYLRLGRNANYWKVDKNGHQLPYLDEIVFLIISNLDQVELKIESGEIDTFYSIRAQDVAAIENKSSSVGMKLYRLGPSYGYEGIFFNQNGGINPQTGKPFLDPVKYSWFTDVHFRKAVSYSIDRGAMVKNALFGMGLPSYGPESPSNVFWYNDKITKYPLDLQKARTLLDQSGFHIKTIEGKAILYDRKGNQVRFSLYTNAGNTVRNQESLIIVNDLAKIGMQVEYTPLEFKELVSRITTSYEYDAILLGKTHESEPSDGINAWLSSSSSHFWYPKQPTTDTSWQKRIDELVMLQNKVFDRFVRKRYYDEIQQILSDQVPMIFTVNEMVVVSAKKGIGNLKPTVSRHRTLWNSEELYWKQ
jgi:peptide/nickel transport system substrate-binding protein